MHSEDQIVLCMPWLVSSKSALGFVSCNWPLKSHVEFLITPDLSWALLFQEFIILSSNLPFIEGSLTALQFPGSHWNFLKISIIFNNIDFLVKGSLSLTEVSIWQFI